MRRKTLQLSVQTFLKSPQSLSFLRLKKVFADYKEKFMPKASLAKWGFTICPAKKFSVLRAWIFLAVDGITVIHGRPACTHVCTYIGASLYISANLIPFLLALWERMDTPRSLVSRAFAGSELKSTALSIRYRIFPFFTSPPVRLRSLLFVCIQRVPEKLASL